jgi:hypothetical protein
MEGGRIRNSRKSRVPPSAARLASPHSRGSPRPSWPPKQPHQAEKKEHSSTREPQALPCFGPLPGFIPRSPPVKEA